MYRTKIKDRIKHKPWLIPMFSNIFCIPERLRRNDPNLFVVFNKATQKYEIHSLDNKGDSFSLQVPFKELDARTEEFVKKYDLRRHGMKIYREIDEHNERLEEQNRRQRSNDIYDMAREIYPLFKRYAYWGE